MRTSRRIALLLVAAAGAYALIWSKSGRHGRYLLGVTTLLALSFLLVYWYVIVGATLLALGAWAYREHRFDVLIDSHRSNRKRWGYRRVPVNPGVIAHYRLPREHDDVPF